MPASYSPLPPLAQLRKFLVYCPETGVFQWTEIAHAKVRGKLTGTKPVLSGYAQIRFAGKAWMAHRLAWYMHHAEDPGVMQIDHINGNRVDNRIGNLRLASNAENSMNRRLANANTSGHKGVSWMKSYSKWEAYIWRDYKKHLLGYFDNREDAADAVRLARSSFHSNFARHE